MKTNKAIYKFLFLSTRKHKPEFKKFKLDISSKLIDKNKDYEEIYPFFSKFKLVQFILIFISLIAVSVKLILKDQYIYGGFMILLALSYLYIIIRKLTPKN